MEKTLIQRITDRVKWIKTEKNYNGNYSKFFYNPYKKEKFEMPEILRGKYHGGCVGCSRNRKDKEYRKCKKCCFYHADWMLPELNDGKWSHR